MIDVILRALAARLPLLDDRHEGALRLLNGFTEGAPELVIDLYARTALIHWHGQQPLDAATLDAVRGAITGALPFVRAVVLKDRNAAPLVRKGRLVFGDAPDRKILEHAVWHSIDLLLNRDASFYLDTRTVRAWAQANLRGSRVLNTFAYTGSLGVAARAGGAAHVMQLDLNRAFLNVAKTSHTLNGFSIHKADFVTADFFPAVARFKREGRLFDCVFLDPPFFSSTVRGRVDALANFAGLMNKVRPLIAHGGWLVAINNALFLSGEEFERMLGELCKDGYLKLEQRIPVSQDVIGFGAVPPIWPKDPAPYNHPTKIALLRVMRRESVG